jgi:hypothetical protein
MELFTLSKGLRPDEEGTSSPLHAAIVGGCLLSFRSDVSPQDQQDIQDCLTYAELAANDRYQVESSTGAWFDYYQGRLLKAGFTLKTIIPSTPLHAGNLYELTNAAFGMIGSLGSEKMSQLARQTYKALRVDDFAWDYFRGNVMKGSLTVAKFAPCEHLVTGDIAVFLFGLRYKATVIEEDFFFWNDFDRQVTLIPDGGVFVFNRDAFANYREGIYRKIDNYSGKIIVQKLNG